MASGKQKILRGKMFGKNRTKEIVRKYSKSSADDILKTIMTELKTFRDDVKQEDDVTLVIIKVK